VGLVTHEDPSPSPYFHTFYLYLGELNFCVPKGVTNGQAFAMWEKYLNDYPQIWHLKIIESYGIFLVNAFPCKLNPSTQDWHTIRSRLRPLLPPAVGEGQDGGTVVWPSPPPAPSPIAGGGTSMVALCSNVMWLDLEPQPAPTKKK
jgi:hypothetical protein